MKLFFILLSLSSLSFASIVRESHFCPINFHNGSYTGHQRLILEREVATSNVQHAFFELSFSYVDTLIYRKDTNTLVGDRVYLQRPEFPSFEQWSANCETSELRLCDLVEYKIEKETYDNDRRWVLETFEITPENPDYFLVKTQFRVVQQTQGDVKLTQNSGFDGRYVFHKDEPLSHTVTISNEFDKDKVFIKSKLWGYFSMLDGKTSFSPFLQIKLQEGSAYSQGGRNTQPCSKEADYLK